MHFWHILYDVCIVSFHSCNKPAECESDLFFLFSLFAFVQFVDHFQQCAFDGHFLFNLCFPIENGFPFIDFLSELLRKQIQGILREIKRKRNKIKIDTWRKEYNEKYGSIQSIEQVGIIIRELTNNKRFFDCSAFNRLFDMAIVRCQKKYNQTPNIKKNEMKNYSMKSVRFDLYGVSFVEHWIRSTFIPLPKVSVSSMQFHIDCVPIEQYNNARSLL